MYCIKCGQVLLETDIFCSSCGANKETNINNQNMQQQVDIMNPNLTDVERARLYSSYTRKLWYSALGPFLSLFLIVTLWGLMALLRQIFEDISVLVEILSIFIPILVALSVLAIPVGIILGIIYASKRNQFKPIIR